MSERVLYTEDGDEVKVPSEETIAELQKQQDVVSNLMSELEIKDGEDIKEKIKELKEGINPNWAETRKQIKTLEATVKHLESQGKEIDENGQIVDKKGVSPDELKKMARDEAKLELINEKIDNALELYDEEEKKVINSYFKKLTAGEEITTKNVDKFIEQSIKASGIDGKNIDEAKRSFNRIGSKSSGGSGNSKNFAETDAGRNLLERMNIKLEDKK